MVHGLARGGFRRPFVCGGLRAACCELSRPWRSGGTSRRIWIHRPLTSAGLKSWSDSSPARTVAAAESRWGPTATAGAGAHHNLRIPTPCPAFPLDRQNRFKQPSGKRLKPVEAPRALSPEAQPNLSNASAAGHAGNNPASRGSVGDFSDTCCQEVIGGDQREFRVPRATATAAPKRFITTGSTTPQATRPFGARMSTNWPPSHEATIDSAVTLECRKGLTRTGMTIGAFLCQLTIHPKPSPTGIRWQICG